MWLIISLTCFVAVVALVVIANLYMSYKKQDLVVIHNKHVSYDGSLTQVDQATKLAIQIPTTIFQNHKRRKIPPNLAKSIRRLQAHAPEFNYIFYDDAESREYIKQNYPKALEAYDTLLPGAYKSDLFRIVRLYCEGGVYFDAPFNPYDDDFRLGDWLQPEDAFVSSDDRGHGVYNAFMAAIPKHPISKRAIEIIIDNVAHRRYGKDPLSITGPSIYHQIFQELYHQPISETTYSDTHGQVRLILHKYDNYVVEGDTIRYNSRYPSYQLDRFIYWSDSPHYSTLWHSKNVFLPRMYQTTRNTLLWSDGLFALARKLGMNCYKSNTDEWEKDSTSDKIYIGTADDTFPTDIDPETVTHLYQKYRVLYVQNLDRAQLTSEQSDRTIAVPIGVDLHTLQNTPAWGSNNIVPWRKQESQLRTFSARAPQLKNRLKKILITWTYDSATSSRHVTPQVDNAVDVGALTGVQDYTEFKSRMELYRELNGNPVGKLSLGMRVQVWRVMGTCAFVYSPIGNGFDCHRTWEALAMGCIVIAQPNPALREFVGKYPIIFHNNPGKITVKDMDRWLNQYTSAPHDQLEMGAFF